MPFGNTWLNHLEDDRFLAIFVFHESRPTADRLNEFQQLAKTHAQDGHLARSGTVALLGQQRIRRLLQKTPRCD